MKPIMLLAGLLAAGPALAGDYEMRVVAGSVQLGGTMVLAVTGDLPAGARCRIELPAPYDGYATQQTETCGRIEITEAFAPLRDDQGYALPSAQVPATIHVLAADGSALGRVDTMFPYENAFSDLRIVLKGVKNPVSAGESFAAEVQGAGHAIDPSLTCRWATYGPVSFEPTSENGCTGTVTALAPDGQDAEMDVEIVNLTDMHDVGYAIGRMIVK